MTGNVLNLEKILQGRGRRTAFLLPEKEGSAARRISYEELAADVRSYARGCSLLFRAALVSDNPSDRFVGILAERGVESVAAFLGLMEAGFCPSLMEIRAPLPV
ncbi:MAG: hypothetical protein LBC14_04735, partial [Desulfovibrio sp.]|nr:hypothetical protein [Desulfovibrio sp.]